MTVRLQINQLLYDSISVPIGSKSNSCKYFHVLHWSLVIHFSVSKLSVYCRTLSYFNHIIFEIRNHTWLVPAEDSKELSVIINKFIFLVHIQISSIRRIECTSIEYKFVLIV